MKYSWLLVGMLTATLMLSGCRNKQKVQPCAACGAAPTTVNYGTPVYDNNFVNSTNFDPGPATMGPPPSNVEFQPIPTGPAPGIVAP